MADKDPAFLSLAKRILFLSPKEKEEFETMADAYCRKFNVKKRA